MCLCVSYVAKPKRCLSIFPFDDGDELQKLVCRRNIFYVIFFFHLPVRVFGVFPTARDVVAMYYSF